MKKWLLYLSIICLFASVFIFLNSYLARKHRQEAEKNGLAQALLYISPTPKVTLNDIYLYGQKLKTTKEATSSPMYFSIKRLPVQNARKIEIYLKSSDPLSRADAADLVMHFSNTRQIDITTGKSFPLYPRQVSNNGTVWITAIAKIEDNALSLGIPDTRFATLTLYPQDPLQPIQGTYEIQNSTKIFYLGKNVLDETKLVNPGIL